LRRYRSNARRITAKIEDYAANPAALANVASQMVGKDYRRLRIGVRVLFRETPIWCRKQIERTTQM